MLSTLNLRLRRILNRMNRLLLPFMLFGNFAAMWFNGIVLPISFSYLTFTTVIIWPFAWGIRRRWFIS
jgi:hypothetical protein